MHAQRSLGDQSPPNHWQQQQQQTSRSNDNPHHEHIGAALRREFRQQYYVNDAMLAIDAAFYAVHVITIAMQQRVFGTQTYTDLTFKTTCAVGMYALVVCLFFRPLYRRTRSYVVLATHLVLTVMRAAVFLATASRQAVLYRGPALVVEEQTKVGPMLLMILMVTAVPMRLFEVLGLQQTCHMHALVAVAFLVLHPAAAPQGARMAWSNAGFYAVHEAHDVVAAVVEGFLSTITGIPTATQETCSSCVGLVVYGTIGLWGSVAVPLYLAFVIEQGAFLKWCRRRIQGPGSTTTHVAQLQNMQGHSGNAGGVSSLQDWNGGTLGGSYSHSQSNGSSLLRNRMTGHTAAPSNGLPWRPGSPGSASASSNSSSSYNRPAQDRLLLQVNSSYQQDLAFLGGLFAQLSSVPSMPMRWCFHMLMLVMMLVMSWLLSNAFALVLLPKVLSTCQLDGWCPNRPYVPFLDAGLTYEGL